MPDETEPEAAAATTPAADRTMERVAGGLLGAASGGVLGLMVCAVAGRFLAPASGLPAVLTAAGVALLAAAMAFLSLRQPLTPLPVVPRIVRGLTLTTAGLLITLSVFLLQSAYVQGLMHGGGQPRLPLPIWPWSRALLILSLVLVAPGVLMALGGWPHLAARRDEYTGGRWIALSVLVGGAWAGLAMACYLMGYGLPLGR